MDKPKGKKSKNYTVMFIPDENARPFSFRISKAVVRAFAAFVIIFLIGLGILLFRTGEIGMRLQLLHSLREENAKLKQQNEKLLIVAQKLHQMEQMSAYLRRLAMVTGVGEAGGSAVAEGAKQDEEIFREDSLDNFLKQLQKQEAQQLENIAEPDATPELLLGSIPNIRPVEGWITKTFTANASGGIPKHEGVDFAAAQGTLIRATAPGTIAEIENDKYLGLIVTI